LTKRIFFDIIYLAHYMVDDYLFTI